MNFLKFLKTSTLQNTSGQLLLYGGQGPGVGRQIKDRIYSKQGSHIFLLYWTRNLVLFSHAGPQPEFFQGKGGFMELGHFNKHFVKNKQKKGPPGKNFGIFSP